MKVQTMDDIAESKPSCYGNKSPLSVLEAQRSVGSNRRKQSKPLKVGDETSSPSPSPAAVTLTLSLATAAAAAAAAAAASPGSETTLADDQVAFAFAADAGLPASLASTQDSALDQLNYLRSTVTSSGYITTNPATYVNSVPALNETYCEICNKVYCNKYFLKTHKMNKHGIKTDTRRSSASPPATLPSQVLTTCAGAGAGAGAHSTGGLVSQDCKQAVLAPHDTGLPSILPQLLRCPEPHLNLNPSELAIDQHVHVLTQPAVTAQASVTQRCTDEMETKWIPLATTPTSANTSSKASLTASRSELTLDVEQPQQQPPPPQQVQTGDSQSCAINPLLEDFCEICKKHLCNKYYLKKHKLDAHGIVSTTPSSAAGMQRTASASGAAKRRRLSQSSKDGSHMSLEGNGNTSKSAKEECEDTNGGPMENSRLAELRQVATAAGPKAMSPMELAAAASGGAMVYDPRQSLFMPHGLVGMTSPAHALSASGTDIPGLLAYLQLNKFMSTMMPSANYEERTLALPSAITQSYLAAGNPLCHNSAKMPQQEDARPPTSFECADLFKQQNSPVNLSRKENIVEAERKSPTGPRSGRETQATLRDGSSFTGAWLKLKRIKKRSLQRCGAVVKSHRQTQSRAVRTSDEDSVEVVQVRRPTTVYICRKCRFSTRWPKRMAAHCYGEHQKRVTFESNASRLFSVKVNGVQLSAKGSNGYPVDADTTHDLVQSLQFLNDETLQLPTAVWSNANQNELPRVLQLNVNLQLFPQ